MKKYESPFINVKTLEIEDVIATSDFQQGENELPLKPPAGT